MNYHDLEKLKYIQAQYEDAKQTRENTEKLIRDSDLPFYLSDEDREAIENAHTAMEKLEDALFRAGLSLAQKLSKAKNLIYHNKN